MNRKVLFAFALLMVLAMLATPLACAVPLGEDKNDKFQTWLDTGTFSVVYAGSHSVATLVPSIDKPNLLFVDLDEQMLTYSITIGSRTYTLAKDFAYTGHVQYKYVKPVLVAPGQLPTEFKVNTLTVDYSFDFSAKPGSIDGVLNMRAVFTEGSIRIRSTSGTGDLRNVEVQLLNLPGGFTPPITVIVNHGGMVLGWPDIAPNP